jgi:hypothetical protein
MFIYSAQLARFNGSLDDNFVHEHAFLCEHLNFWHIAFDYMSAEQTHTWHVNDRLVANTIKIQALGIWIWTATCLSSNQSAFDAFIPQFEAIVTLAEHTIDIFAPEFCIDIGIIYILHLAGVKCRDARLRRRILGVFKRRRWREGLTDSWISYRIVHREMTIEERNLDLQSDPNARPDEKDRIQASNMAGPAHKDEGTNYIKLDLYSLPDGPNFPFKVWHEYIEVEGELPPYLNLDTPNG